MSEMTACQYLIVTIVVAAVTFRNSRVPTFQLLLSAFPAFHYSTILPFRYSTIPAVIFHFFVMLFYFRSDLSVCDINIPE